ncbi:Gfo/Idh/MocA family oxidoreductase [Arthrobacter flavus]|uniref:Gfo/Idh/MocA family protein n=1 Tax=Arthrobacter flavus TaxID=95172 RepID=A0ABW4QAT4_9MICC
MSHTPIRIGLIGAGGIADAHISHLQRLGAEVYVYSLDGAEELVAQFGGTVVHSIEELFDLVTIVDICSPTFTHFELAKKALEAGKNVICEKPLTRHDDEAVELSRLAAANGLTILPAHVVRFFPEYAELAAAVHAGQLGELAVLRLSRSGAFPNRSPWFGDRRLSGGIIMDQMIHDIDIARWLAGPVAQISAISTTVGDETEPAETAHVLLRHESGAISQISGVWGPPHTTFTTEYSVTGTLGRLEHHSGKQQNFVANLQIDESGGGLIPAVDPLANPYFLELREFLEALTDGSSARVDCEDGVEAVRLANAALQSLETGQPVTLSKAGV